MNQFVQQQWDLILKENHDELIEHFRTIGEPAYGVYLNKLLKPIFKQLTDAGLNVKPGFIMPNSIEHWGPPEERERCIWCVVRKKDETPLGTLVLRMFHSHTKFDVPSLYGFKVCFIKELRLRVLSYYLCLLAGHLQQHSAVAS